GWGLREEANVGEGNVVRAPGLGWRTRKVEGWPEGTGGAVRAQHDAIRAGTRRSLRSERRDASAESVAWIARSVVAGARGVPLSSRITPTGLFRFYRATGHHDGKKGGGSVSRTIEAAAAFRSARKSSPDDPERTPRRVQPDIRRRN
ncbi:hypothetical protein X777_08997, partial [Ooceraea biroi]